jgi:membrane associated rhomboid family serine protease
MSSHFFVPSNSATGLETGSSKLRGLLRWQPSLRRSYNQSYFGGHDTSQTNMYIIYGLIGINSAVFAYWQYAKTAAQQGYADNWKWMYKNFTLRLSDVLRENRYWTTMTSVFSHQSFWHLLGNLLSFYYMGRLVAMTPGIGPARFLTLILGSGFAGSVGYLFDRYQRTAATRHVDYMSGLGFSGAVMGVGTAAAMMYPTTTFMIYGIIPAPLWAIMGGYLVYDGFYLNSESGRTAHAGHLGGTAFGVLYYFLSIRRGIFRR